MARFPDENARNEADVKREYVALFSAISTSEKLADLQSDSHRLFYTWLLAQTDPWGRIESSPRILNAKVWPVLGHSADETAAAIRDCCRLGLLQLHTLLEDSWIQVPDWEEKAGKLRRDDRCGKSKWPEPLESSRSTPGVDGSTPSQSRGEESREEKKAAPPARRSSKARAEPETELQGQEPWVVETVTAWVAYRTEKRLPPYTPSGFKALASKVLQMGQLRARAALAHSMASNYQGLFEPGQNGHAPPAGPKPKTDRDTYRPVSTEPRNENPPLLGDLLKGIRTKPA